jgi:2-phospho-L-lactate/phosphoenolpyruvate guanylyltransferase
MSLAPVWAIVPVKPFHMAKRRLAPVLDAGERARLARLMFEDVLDAVTASQQVLAGVLALTADERAAEIARRRGVRVIAEASPTGLSAAIEQAIGCLAASPGDGMLVVPADLPHLTPAAIERIVRLLNQPQAVALVRAIEDGGTNLLACRPADVVLPRFGAHSFARHVEAARRIGITPTVLELSDLGRDIDRPGDLEPFLSLGTATRTHAFLSALRIHGRARSGAQPLSRGMTSRAIVSI